MAPTDPLPVVRYDPRAGERSLDVMRWGLMPFWAKDIKVGFANINAKAEGIEGKPAFREAFQRRRCLVPVDNFYRGKTAAEMQPFAIALAEPQRPQHLPIGNRCGGPTIIFDIAPGHDSWVVGDEPYVSLHFLGADLYADDH